MASTGSILEALKAGTIPAKIPITVETPIAIVKFSKDKNKLNPKFSLKLKLTKAMPIKIINKPNKPPIMHKIIDSTKNCKRIK